MIGDSAFVEKMSERNLEMLKVDNEIIFKEIRLE
jgi:hypothetical protein